MHLCDQAPGQSVESTPRDPLGATTSDHGSETTSQLVAVVESLLPILDYESDGYESFDSCVSMAEVYMVVLVVAVIGSAAKDGTNSAVENIILGTSIHDDSDAEKALQES